jgi:hypothetical protein
MGTQDDPFAARRDRDAQVNSPELRDEDLYPDFGD